MMTSPTTSDEHERPTVPEWIKTDEVAEMTGVTTYAVRNWVQRNVGPPYYRIMGQVRYKRQDVEGWIEAQRVEAKR